EPRRDLPARGGALGGGAAMGQRHRRRGRLDAALPGRLGAGRPAQGLRRARGLPQDRDRLQRPSPEVRRDGAQGRLAMTLSPESAELWRRLDDLTDVEVAALTQAAIHVLEVGGDDPSLREAETMPARPLTATLEQELSARAVAGPDVARRIVSDHSLSRPIAINLLKTIATDPVLAEEVAAAYRARQKLLTVGVDLILAGALLLLVLK